MHTNTGFQDVNGVDIYEGDTVYLAGLGDCVMTYPFNELWAAYPENDIGEIINYEAYIGSNHSIICGNGYKCKR